MLFNGFSWVLEWFFFCWIKWKTHTRTFVCSTLLARVSTSIVYGCINQPTNELTLLHGLCRLFHLPTPFFLHHHHHNHHTEILNWIHTVESTSSQIESRVSLTSIPYSYNKDFLFSSFFILNLGLRRSESQSVSLIYRV